MMHDNLFITLRVDALLSFMAIQHLFNICNKASGLWRVFIKEESFDSN